MRISDWSSDVCSSDLPTAPPAPPPPPQPKREAVGAKPRSNPGSWATNADYPSSALRNEEEGTTGFRVTVGTNGRVTDCSVTSSSGSSTLDEATCRLITRRRSEEHTSELQSLMRISYAVFCLKKKKKQNK